jgi:hypothetical protein
MCRVSWGNLPGRVHVEDLGDKYWNNIKLDLKEI